MSEFRIFCIGGFVGMVTAAILTNYLGLEKGTAASMLRAIATYLVFGAAAVVFFSRTKP